MVCHSICKVDDMTDVTIWQNFPHLHQHHPLTCPPDLREPYRTYGHFSP